MGKGRLGRGGGRGRLLLKDGLAGDAHEAQPVEDGLLEAAHLGEAGVDMQGAATTR